MVVRALEPEPPGTGVGSDLWPQAAQQGVQALPSDDPPGLADTGGKVGLDPLPLPRERLLPVGLEKAQEPLKQAPRILQQLPRQRLIARRGRTLPQPAADVRRLQRRRIARDSPAGLRADQRDRELQTHQLLVDAAQPPQLALEVRKLPSRQRKKELREVRTIRERE